MIKIIDDMKGYATRKQVIVTLVSLLVFAGFLLAVPIFSHPTTGVNYVQCFG